MIRKSKLNFGSQTPLISSTKSQTGLKEADEDFRLKLNYETLDEANCDNNFLSRNKVIEAYMHDNDSHFSVIIRGKYSCTFQIDENKEDDTATLVYQLESDDIRPAFSRNGKEIYVLSDFKLNDRKESEIKGYSVT